MPVKHVKVRPRPAVTAQSLVALSSPVVTEGDSGIVILRFVLSRAADGYGPITYRAYTTASGSATAGTDFYTFSQSGSISASGTVNLDVTVVGDVIDESDETVQMEVYASWP